MARITLIASGKGGTGKTTAAAYLGYFLQKNGVRTILLELDSGLRGLDCVLGIEAGSIYNLEDVLKQPEDVVKAISISQHFAGLSLVTAGTAKTVIKEETLSKVISKLGQMCDCLLIDAPAGIGREVRIAASAADDAVIVTHLSPICARDALALSRILEQQGLTQQRLIINRLDGKLALKSGFYDLDEFIDAVEVQLLGVVPLQEDLIKFESEGKPADSSTEFYRAFEEITERYRKSKQTGIPLR